MKLLIALAAIIAVFVGGRFITIGYPFAGPGVSENKREHEKLIAVVTRGEIEFGKGKRFFEDLNMTMDAIPGSEGLVGYAARKQLIGPKVWTLSVWLDQESLQKFVRSESHQAAASNGSIRPDSFVSKLFEVPPENLPISWKAALAALRE